MDHTIRAQRESKEKTTKGRSPVDHRPILDHGIVEIVTFYASNYAPESRIRPTWRVKEAHEAHLPWPQITANLMLMSLPLFHWTFSWEKKKDKIKKLNVRHQRAATERGQKKKHSIPRACHLFHDDFFSLSLALQLLPALIVIAEKYRESDRVTDRYPQISWSSQTNFLKYATNRMLLGAMWFPCEGFFKRKGLLKHPHVQHFKSSATALKQKKKSSATRIYL